MPHDWLDLPGDDRAQAIAVEVEHVSSHKALDVFGHRQAVVFDDEGQQSVGNAFGRVRRHGERYLKVWGFDPSYIGLFFATASSPIISNFQCADLKQISRDEIVSFPLPAEPATDQAGARPAGDISPFIGRACREAATFFIYPNQGLYGRLPSTS